MLKSVRLFFIFVKIGAVLLGGGYVVLPILMNEFVEKRSLITHDEMIGYYALSQSLPGIVAVNISLFVGYKVCKVFGAIAALFGLILCPFLCIILLAEALSKMAGNSYIQGIFWGVGVAVIALIILTVREFWKNIDKNLYFYLIFLLSLILFVIFKLSPVQVILLTLFLGVFIYKFIGGKIL